MTIDELREQARRVLAVAPAAGYEHRTFACRSGGAPRNDAGVPEVHREDEYAYDTVRHGAAYRGSVTVECRDTGARDAGGRPIYETPGGVVFVYRHRPGSPEYFDSGRLAAPELAVSPRLAAGGGA